METAIQFIVNGKGTKTSVVVPIKNWNRLNTDYIKLKNKLEVLSGIKSGLEEIKRAKKQGVELQNLNEFLNENDNYSYNSFKRKAKPLLKKYHSLKNELLELEMILLNEQTFGESLGNNLYKIKIAVESKGKGKKWWIKNH